MSALCVPPRAVVSRSCFYNPRGVSEQCIVQTTSTRQCDLLLWSVCRCRHRKFIWMETSCRPYAWIPQVTGHQSSLVCGDDSDRQNLNIRTYLRRRRHVGTRHRISRWYLYHTCRIVGSSDVDDSLRYSYEVSRLTLVMLCRCIGVIILALRHCQVCLYKVLRIQDDVGIVNICIISKQTLNNQGEWIKNNVDVIRDNRKLSMNINCRFCSLPNWKSNMRGSNPSWAKKGLMVTFFVIPIKDRRIYNAYPWPCPHYHYQLTGMSKLWWPAIIRL